jgi:hypothetical protein
MFSSRALASSITAGVGIDHTSATDSWCRNFYFYTNKGNLTWISYILLRQLVVPFFRLVSGTCCTY